MYYITEDRKNWTEKKRAARATAARIHGIADRLMLHSGKKLTEEKDKSEKLHRRAGRISSCADRLVFRACSECSVRTLVRAELCRDRLCPICSWRRARALATKIKNIVSDNSAKVTCRYVLLTLTIKNCEWENLSNNLRQMLGAWVKLARRTRFKRAFSGWVRTIEITRGKDGRAHPHMHILLETGPDYFGGDNWLTQTEIVNMWKKCLGVRYTPVVDIRAVKEARIGGAIAEVTKYIAKAADMEGLDDAEFLAYATAVAGVRMYGAGGTMRKLDEEITEIEMLAAGEDREEDRHVCPICGRLMQEYTEKWDFSTKCYTVEGMSLPEMSLPEPPPDGITIINYGVVRIAGKAYTIQNIARNGN